MKLRRPYFSVGAEDQENAKGKLAINATQIPSREQLCLKSSRNRVEVGLPADAITHHDVKDG